MKKFQVVLLSVIGISLLLTAAFKILNVTDYLLITGAPALIILCLIFLGHFVTLDEELSGGWSNPDGSKKIALLSIGELVIKFVVLVFCLWLVFG